MRQKWKKVVFYAAVLLLGLLGICCATAPGYGFSSYLCFAAVGLLLVLRLLQCAKGRWARVVRTALCTVLALALVLSVITGCLIVSGGRDASDTACAYLIVLGAGVNGTRPSLILSERIDRACRYLTAHPETVCIASGGKGSGESITEAQCIYDELTARGIDPSRIWLEEQATDTRENIRYSLELIEQRTGVRPTEAAVVSNEFHLYRAGMFAAREQLQMVPVAAKTTWASLRINYFLREIVAVWYYALFGN